MNHIEGILPGAQRSHSILRCLLDAGVLDDYLVYDSGTETRIVGGCLARVLLSGDALVLEGPSGARRSERAHDPFKQIERVLAEAGIPDWTAYGYVTFDVARFYYPYGKAMGSPLVHLVVPEVEIRLRGGRAFVRSAANQGAIERIVSTARDDETPARISPPDVDLSDRDDYQDKVVSLSEAIRAGELQKAILSRHVDVPGSLDVLGTYASAVRTNNAARSYCFRLGSVAGVGLSPELLLEADTSGSVMTNPLAGTRPRGADAEEDLRLRNELFTDAKEVKEHVLSILAAQEEIRSICLADSVRICDFMQVKRFRCVQHLSSRVSGRLAPGKTAWDALKALFPGITVSGIDKGAALRFIDSLEREPRGVYGGTVGWIDSRGAADMAIAIRAVYQYGSTVRLNAGAGIVAESIKESEYIESVNKMNTMRSQLVLQPR
ncbi:salicylate synthase [Sorangium cellulosum]|uniref:Salicylate synthase n=1 Tax=Sorangium cellulosum TaxID=56 RepID=A0A150SC08_SORCE|nr:salicylate synthase [Sorangium cellulosum]